MDRAYMERGLASHLQSIPGFASIDVQLLREIAKRAKLKVFAKDETIVNEGAAADGLYLIREGFVRVVKAMSGGEARTVAYLNDGAYFGETAMLRAERCSATVIAMGKVEVIHIMKEDFFTLVNRDRNMAQLFAGANAAENPDLSRTQVRTAMGFVGEVVAKGVVKATSALVIHLDACTRCGNCVKACAELHDGISRLTRHGMLLEVPALKASMQPERLLVATSCMHCLDPECMIGCPTGAINRDINGEVVIEDSCIGCGNCARRCPYGNISMAEVSSEHELEKQRGGAPAIGAYLKLWRTPEGEKMMHEAESENRKAVVRRIAVKCDLCQDYNYNHGCVYNCPYSAIERMDPSRNLEQLRDRD
jgi:Fe-S-cluster-containing hydrogenase component 2